MGDNAIAVPVLGGSFGPSSIRCSCARWRQPPFSGCGATNVAAWIRARFVILFVVLGYLVWMKAGNTKKCRIAVRSDDAQQAVMLGNRTLDLATQAFSRVNFVLERQTCKPYKATIGSNSNSTEYRFCRVQLR